MNKIIFPLSSGETGCHRLDPIVKEQLKAKPSTGGFYEDYSPAAEDIDIPGARASATYGIDISADVEVQSFNIPCGTHYLPARRYRLPKASRRVILYLHGGGFTVGSIAHKDAQCRYLAETSRSTVISLEYRLAPENPYPAAIEDTITALHYCSNLKPEKLIIGGDSAGGCLAANAIQQGSIPVDYAFFIYAALDLASASQMKDPWSYSFYVCDEAEKPLVYNRLNRFRKLAEDIKVLYLQNNTDLLSELVSPCRIQNVSKFPKSLFVIAEYDYYRFCNEAFAQRLEWQNMHSEILFYEGVDHGFFDRLGSLPQAKSCIEEIGSRIQRL